MASRLLRNMQGAVASRQAKRAADPYSRDGLVRQQNDEMDYQREQGRWADDEYRDFAGDFDASQHLNEWARGAYASVSEGISDQLGDLEARSVGAGRLDTGFYDEDQGEIVKDNMANFNSALSQQALGAASLQAGVKGRMGDYGLQRSGEANDLLMSRREEVENNARELAKRRRKRRSGIGGAIGGALGAAGGFLAGGPAGAAAGWKYGGQIGSSF